MDEGMKDVKIAELERQVHYLTEQLVQVNNMNNMLKAEVAKLRARMGRSQIDRGDPNPIVADNAWSPPIGSRPPAPPSPGIISDGRQRFKG